MKNLTAQQKLRVQKEFAHFKITHGVLPTKLSDFKAGSFSRAERPYASWLVKQLKKKKNNPSHLEKLDSDIRKLKKSIEREKKHLNKLEVKGKWKDANEVRNRIFELMNRERLLERERAIQDEIFHFPYDYDEDEDINQIQRMIQDTIFDIKEGFITPKEGKKRIFLLKKMKNEKR